MYECNILGMRQLFDSCMLVSPIRETTDSFPACTAYWECKETDLRAPVWVGGHPHCRAER